MAALDNVIKTLKENKNELSKEYNVKTVGIFGSYARGDCKKTSDVDILVEFKKTPSLFEFVELKDHLSDLIGKNVDLVMKDALRPNIGKHIMKEAVYV